MHGALMQPPWLRSYFGEYFARLNPTVIFDGKKKAVVKLIRSSTSGYSGIGYLLISKTGSHASSTPISLAEGLVSQAQLDAMKARLQQEDE